MGIFYANLARLSIYIKTIDFRKGNAEALPRQTSEL